MSAITGDLIARRDLPLFEIEQNLEHGFLVHLNGRRYPLSHVVQVLLGGRIAFRESATVRVEPSIAVGSYSARCWRCAGEVAVYRVLGRTLQGRTACGATLRWTNERSAAVLRNAVRSAVRSRIGAGGCLATRLALIRKRSTGRREIGESWCFGCPHCGASLIHVTLPRRPEAVVMPPVGEKGPSQVEWPHWCYGAGGSFCGNRMTSVIG